MSTASTIKDIERKTNQEVFKREARKIIDQLAYELEHQQMQNYGYVYKNRAIVKLVDQYIKLTEAIKP